MRIFDSDKDVNIDICAHSLLYSKNKYCMEFNLFDSVEGSLIKCGDFERSKLTQILGGTDSQTSIICAAFSSSRYVQ